MFSDCLAMLLKILSSHKWEIIHLFLQAISIFEHPDLVIVVLFLIESRNKILLLFFFCQSLEIFIHLNLGFNLLHVGSFLFQFLLLRILFLLQVVVNRAQVFVDGFVSIGDDHSFSELEHRQLTLLVCCESFIFTKILNTFETGLIMQSVWVARVVYMFWRTLVRLRLYV